MLGFNDLSTLVGHFVSYPRERDKRDRRDSRGDEREGQGRLIVLGFNDKSTLIGHFVLSPREREKIEEIVQEMKERNWEERGTGIKS